MDVIHRGKVRIIIVFAALFLVIATLLILIFNEGKKSYTVTFDLDGGTLISGSLEQTVQQGQDAIPPKAVKDGAYLHSWSGAYQRVTRNSTVRAVWEYETTVGIEYADSANRNYTEIVGAYKYLQGEVYLGAYHNNKKILGICDRAFSGCEGVTRFYLLDGLISIGDQAFFGCSSLTEIEIPETVVRLGKEAFSGCAALKTLTLNEGLAEIGEGAFKDCSSLTEIEIPATVGRIGADAFSGCESLQTVVLNKGITEIDARAFSGCVSLKSLILPESIEVIGDRAFEGCEGLVVKTPLSEEDAPEGFAVGWDTDVRVEWDALIEPPSETDEDGGTDESSDPES